jgi:hypothetical protein
LDREEDALAIRRGGLRALTRGSAPDHGDQVIASAAARA